MVVGAFVKAEDGNLLLKSRLRLVAALCACCLLSCAPVRACVSNLTDFFDLTVVQPELSVVVSVVATRLVGGRGIVLIGVG